MNNIYLIKALRAYRSVSYGQFDQTTSSPIQEMQDAADEIERLNALIVRTRFMPENYSQIDCPACGFTGGRELDAPSQPLSGIEKAAIGVKHFGNPIPQAWYAAANEIERAHGIK